MYINSNCYDIFLYICNLHGQKYIICVYIHELVYILDTRSSSIKVAWP